MRVISRHILSELSKIIVICLGGFIAIYLVIDFFERIDNFLEAQLPLSLALEYFLLKCPIIVQQGIPMAVLMGTLIALGLFVRNNELTALRASGVSPLLLAGPIVMTALFLSLMDFGLAEYLVPVTTSRLNWVWHVKVKKLPEQSGFTQEKLWYKSGNTLYNIRVFHPERQLLEGVTIYRFDDTFRLVQRLDARRGEWDGESWVFTDGIFLNRNADDKFALERFEDRRALVHSRSRLSRGRPDRVRIALFAVPEAGGSGQALDPMSQPPWTPVPQDR